MAEVLRLLPEQNHPNLLVGFDTSDDAGVFLLRDGSALVQTMDFFTPIVDDPYAYGAIAAANALSDVYAMGGVPITAMNIACFDPTMGTPELWSQILQGMADKTAEAGVAVVGGHSVEDDEPKFGLSVTGVVAPDQIFANTEAQAGQKIFLSKPLGSGIVTTAAKFDKASEHEVQAAIHVMQTLNKDAMESAKACGVRCATDITGFGLVGHLGHIARESSVRIEISLSALPLLPGVERMVRDGCITGGSKKNRDAMGSRLEIHRDVPDWLVEVAVDPQTSGGLAVTALQAPDGYVEIGRVVAGYGEVVLLP